MLMTLGRVLFALLFIFSGASKFFDIGSTAQIIEIEKSLGAEFKKKGKEVVAVDRAPFREATVKMHNGPDATWPKEIYDKLQAIK